MQDAFDGAALPMYNRVYDDDADDDGEKRARWMEKGLLDWVTSLLFISHTCHEIEIG